MMRGMDRSRGGRHRLQIFGPEVSVMAGIFREMHPSICMHGKRRAKSI